MTYMEKIDSYGVDLDFIEETSPFELIGTLVKRDELEEVKNSLTYAEKIKLAEYDEKLLNNAKKFYNAIKEVYQFQNRKPISHWWSNIDLVVSGKLPVNFQTAKIKSQHRAFA